MANRVNGNGNGNNNVPWSDWQKLCNQYGQNDPLMGITLFQAWQSGNAFLPMLNNAASLWANFTPSYSPVGDYWSGASIDRSGASSKITDDMTPEEKLAANEEAVQEDEEKQKLVDKFNNMYKLLEEYGNTLSETTNPKKSTFTKLLSKYKSKVSTSTSTEVLNQKIDDLNEVFKKYKTNAITKVAEKKGYVNSNYSGVYATKDKTPKHFYYDEDTCSFKELLGVKSIDAKGNCTYRDTAVGSKSFNEAKSFSDLATEKSLRTTYCDKIYYSDSENKHYIYDAKSNTFTELEGDVIEVYNIAGKEIHFRGANGKTYETSLEHYKTIMSNLSNLENDTQVSEHDSNGKYLSRTKQKTTPPNNKKVIKNPIGSNYEAAKNIGINLYTEMKGLGSGNARDIINSQINRDNIIGVIDGFESISPNENILVYIWHEFNLNFSDMNNIVKNVLRQAEYCGLKNTDEYKAVANDFKISGSIKYKADGITPDESDDFKVLGRVPYQDTHHTCGVDSINAFYDKLKALINKIKNCNK